MPFSVKMVCITPQRHTLKSSKSEIQTAVAAWLWYGGQLVERGRLTVGELTTVVPLALEVASALVRAVPSLELVF